MTARRGDESVVFGVLLVCQANVCRSPSAVALFEHRVASTTLAGSLAFGSAGVRPEPAAGWCRAARSYVRRRGCEPSPDHLPRRLDVDFIESADLVLAMSRRERAAIVRLVPTAASAHVHAGGGGGTCRCRRRPVASARLGGDHRVLARDLRTPAYELDDRTSAVAGGRDERRTWPRRAVDLRRTSPMVTRRAGDPEHRHRGRARVAACIAPTHLVPVVGAGRSVQRGRAAGERASSSARGLAGVATVRTSAERPRATWVGFALEA